MNDLHARIHRLERDVKRLRLFGLVATTLAAGLLVAAFQPRLPSDGVLRAKGLIIEDTAGRERILLGAPVPYAKNRVRTAPQRVEQIWGPRFPKQYLEYYRGYRHAVHGLLVLDERGFDRLAIGDSVPDPNVGKRIGSEVGVVMNDEEGFERTGYGLLNVQGRSRVVVGLDSDRGDEGLVLALYDGGRVGVTVRDGDRTVYLGSAPPNDPVTGLAEAFHGLLLKQGREVKHQVNAAAR